MTDKLKKVYEALSDLKLKDIIIYNFQDFSPFFDYQVIATATNERQVHAAIDHVKQAFPEIVNMHIEGADDNRWLLIDLEDIIVHVMHKDERDFYQIEKIFFEREQIGV
ncbi:MAG: ribosome silencing factor [Candidatus Izemoplasmatales bacterium]|nr:ribosome silencing factor [Candidatus Izemoplasmatales bacterium]MDD4069417.1 ribosome silencing factor [Candidatus Izemoplasmatales bacterium]